MKKIIVANWKMNLSVKQALEYIKKLIKTNQQVAIAAPYTFLAALKNKVSLVGQNVSQYTSGAYTGEISAQMLKEVGCSFCLVGHSERRAYFQETDEVINSKIKLLIQSKVKPILCLGENALQRKRGYSKAIIKKQLLAGLAGVSLPHDLIIAYEPVWAISTFQKGKIKKASSIFDIIEAHQYIRNLLKIKYKSKAQAVKVIYGGTVNGQNCRAILSLPEVEGALVGGASLKVSEFNAIIQSI